MRQKIQYQAVSKTFFVAAAVALPFSAFSQPQPTKSAVHEFQSVCNAPVVVKPATSVFSSFSQPLPKKQAQEGQTSFAVAPPANPPFLGFAQFSQPQFVRGNLPDEQPSALFEILPPGAPPFTGFAQFLDIYRAKINTALYAGWTPTPFSVAPDTHDIVFIDDRKRRKKRDLIKDELERKARLRASIELAAYGPPVEYKIPDFVFDTTPPKPIDLGDLPSQVAMAQQKEAENHRRAAEDQEEEELNLIMRDIV